MLLEVPQSTVNKTIHKLVRYEEVAVAAERRRIGEAVR